MEKELNPLAMMMMMMTPAMVRSAAEFNSELTSVSAQAPSFSYGVKRLNVNH